MPEWDRLLPALVASLLPQAQQARQRREADLQAFRAIVDAVPLAIVALAPDGKVTLWSRGAERIFGWRRGEVEGAEAPYAGPEHAAHETSLRQRVLAGNEIHNQPAQRCDKDGTVRELVVHAVPQRDSNGTVTGIINVMEDVTDRRRLEASREAQRAPLAKKFVAPPEPGPAPKADEAMATFLSRISHDLRQPLHTLSLMTGALERRVKEPQTREIVEDLSQTVRSAQAMFENIVEWTRLESGLIGTEPAVVAADDVLGALAEEFAPEAARRNLAFRWVPARAPVACDPLLLRRVLRHLIDNALKFTPSGKVLLGARRHGPMLRFIVADTGIGIPAGQQDFAFGAYNQLDAGREAGGLGLGLAIAKGLAERAGLEMGVRSDTNQGALFWIDVRRG